MHENKLITSNYNSHHSRFKNNFYEENFYFYFVFVLPMYQSIARTICIAKGLSLVLIIDWKIMANKVFSKEVEDVQVTVRAGSILYNL